MQSLASRPWPLRHHSLEPPLCRLHVFAGSAAKESLQFSAARVTSAVLSCQGRHCTLSCQGRHCTLSCQGHHCTLSCHGDLCTLHMLQ